MSNSLNEIAILDFGSQYTHLIARRIRELGVLSHIYHNDVDLEKLKNAQGIILSGGPRSVVKDPALAYPKGLFELDVPILGLCYGHQLMAHIFGGKVASGDAREYGLAKMTISSSPIFKDIPETTEVWMSHGDHVVKLPEGFQEIAHTDNGSITAMENKEKKWYGFQFHPEVHHTKAGKQMLANFVFDICGCQKNWFISNMVAEIEKNIREQAQNKKVFLLVSGGVDSTVCFALLDKVLGKERVYALHVDHGLMREQESDKVTEALKKIGIDNLHVYHAEAEYLEKLAGVSEPEQKRKIIGDLFLDVTERVMQEQGMDSQEWLVGQGTIYPDTIESGGTRHADVIKTHHNRVPRIQEMIAAGLILEPLKELYKDEVRAVGLELGLPKELVYRRPFPGPGLGVSCLCSEKNESKTTSWPNNFGVNLYKLPVRSVGVQGDERSYAHPALVEFPENGGENISWERLRELSPKITNSSKEVNRVLYRLDGDLEQLSSATVRQAYITKERLEKLRTLESIVSKYVVGNPDCQHIWEVPVVLLPFGYDRGESVVLRPVESEEAMTVSFAVIPKDLLEKIVQEIQALHLVDFIFYDVTNKPPGTIQWE